MNFRYDKEKEKWLKKSSTEIASLVLGAVIVQKTLSLNQE
jgi:hypothetical protein